MVQVAIVARNGRMPYVAVGDDTARGVMMVLVMVVCVASTRMLDTPAATTTHMCAHELLVCCHAGASTCIRTGDRTMHACMLHTGTPTRAHACITTTHHIHIHVPLHILMFMSTHTLKVTGFKHTDRCTFQLVEQAKSHTRAKMVLDTCNEDLGPCKGVCQRDIMMAVERHPVRELRGGRRRWMVGAFASPTDARLTVRRWELAFIDWWVMHRHEICQVDVIWTGA